MKKTMEWLLDQKLSWLFANFSQKEIEGMLAENGIEAERLGLVNEWRKCSDGDWTVQDWFDWFDWFGEGILEGVL